MACAAECPGIVVVDGVSAGCNGHGDCMYDPETETASCKCNEGDGWLGDSCQQECKRGKDDQGNTDAVCSGHGKCKLEEGEPICQCDALYTGDACGVNCPTKVPGSVCSGHGTCQLPELKDGPGQCTCDKGFLGDGCGLSCPSDKDGQICAGHGKCTAIGETARCECDEQWNGDACTERKCGTEAGFFEGSKNECKCPATSEKCCSRDVIEKAAIMDKMIAAHKEMVQSGKTLDMAKMLDHEVMSLDA